MPMLYKVVDCAVRPKLYPVIDFFCRSEDNVVDPDVNSLIETVKSNDYERVKKCISDLKQRKLDTRSVINGENEKHETALCSAVIKVHGYNENGQHSVGIGGWG